MQPKVGGGWKESKQNLISQLLKESKNLQINKRFEFWGVC
jgi:hypothetical protein